MLFLAEYTQAQTRRKAKNGKPAQPKEKKKKIHGHVDYWLLLIVFIILIFGLIMLFSASYPKAIYLVNNRFYYIKNQLIYVAIGIPAMILASYVPRWVMKKFAWTVYVLSIILLIVVLFMAKKNGVRRWIWYGAPGSESGFQPSEIAKFAIILLFATLISKYDKKMKTFKYGVFPFLVLLAIMAILLVLEPHISCTILVMGIGVSMMFAGGTSAKWFFLAVAVILVAGYATYILLPDNLAPYIDTRLDNWLNPLEMNTDDAYQTKQSLIAVGSGGVFGRGLGQSKQKYLYLPEMFNDYIFAVLCEELGLIGALFVMILFLAFLFRSLYLAYISKNKFDSMLLVGVSVQISLQAFLHMAVNTNTIPSTGISLPFFSYGGTALCMVLGEIGIMLSATRRINAAQKAEQVKKEQEEEAKFLKAQQEAEKSYRYKAPAY